MQATKFRLHFTAPLHIASAGVGFEQASWVVHSDTLFSAIITVWSHLDAEQAGRIANAESPPFLLSSAFPYHGALEFYPKPLIRSPIAVAEQHRKKLARVQFIEAEIFRKLLERQRLVFDPSGTRQGGRFWASLMPPASSSSVDENGLQPEAKQKIVHEELIMQEMEVPRVVIDRVTNQGMNYYVSELRFVEQAGLFFWARFLEPAYQKPFMQVLRLLGDEGLGLDRTSGKGLFEIENASDSALPGPSAAQRFLTLSLYAPESEEIDHGLLQHSGYELVQRSGYVSGLSYRRQSLTMFAEGSVFNGAPFAKPQYGAKREVLAPAFAASEVGHPIFRYGYAFPIGFHDEGET